MAYHTWNVEEKRKLKLLNESRRKPLVSIDDLAADKLNPGDILVFERDCSSLHLPYAAHCIMTKKLLGDSLNHLAIVVNDPQSYEPAVLEALPFEGVRLTMFQERIDDGDSVQAVLLPLNLSRGDKNRRERISERLRQFTLMATSTTTIPTSAKDAVGLVLNAYVKAKLLEPDPHLSVMTPNDIASGSLQLTETAKLGAQVPLRAR